ncbi:MAG: CoA transferase [Rhodospirillaceae bacterium]|nr:CoA transferase [Rhodospirillaceae bacterium]MDD9925954.1 CoA transferase [Rhodospirillaceae bacterium]
MAKAFEGVRIVDFTQVLCGPMATAQLALLGAEVIKIEQPEVGDQMRMLSARDHWAETRCSPAFMGVNYGKRSITLNLKSPEAKEIVTRLVKGANAIAENFKPGVLDRLGFGYEWARSVEPSIVYLSISGFGQTGPLRGAGAYDGAIQAMSGMMSTTGTPELGPLRAGFPIADMTTGMNAAFALSSALYRQKATGEGQHLDLAMTDSMLSLMNYSVCRLAVAGDEPELLGNNSPSFQATSSVFPTKDGHLSIAVFTDVMAARLCDAIGHPEWKDDPMWGTTQGRRGNFEEIQSALNDILSQKTTAEWLPIMETEGVPVSPVNTLKDAVYSEQVTQRNFLIDLPAPTGIEGSVQLPGTSFIASEDSPGTDRAAPRVGEHTDEILTELGFDDTEIAGFHDGGVV